MNRALLLFAVLSLGTFTSAQELTKETMTAGVRANLAAYDKIKLHEDGSATPFVVQLGVTTSSSEHGIFDGIRITAPAKLNNRDFIWYFNAPKNWGAWFIVPVEGDFEGGFRNWLDADKLYKDLDKPGEKERQRVLQNLDGAYFKPGQEYILWFLRHGEGDGELRGQLMFASRPKDEESWTPAVLEKVLQLKDAEAEVQADALNSRGALILLDPAFFDRSEAEERIDQVFFDIRQTTWTRGGYFITMEIVCPPCHKKPSLAKIQKKHGAADFVQASEEKALLRKGADNDQAGIEQGTVTHYYDYFGFEVAAGDPSQKVLRVATQASNYAALRPPDDKPFYGRVPMKNLTVFHDKKKEVGRAYYFNEANKSPLFIQEPPPAQYRSGDEALEYQGEGKWLWLTFAGDTVVRRIPFVGHRMHGRGEGFHEIGKPSFVAEYKDGVLEGEVIQYAEDGSITKKQTFQNGAPVRGPVQ